jgi:hypothetical protein
MLEERRYQREDGFCGAATQDERVVCFPNIAKLGDDKLFSCNTVVSSQVLSSSINATLALKQRSNYVQLNIIILISG